MVARVEFQGVGLDDRQATGIMRGHHLQRGEAARVALDGNHAARAGCQQRAGQAAGTGADLQHVASAQISGAAGDLGGEIEVEEEVLAQLLLWCEVEAADDLGQRRKAVDSGHAPARASAISRAARRASMKLRGSAVPCPARS